MALVDWDLATSTAARMGPTGPKVTLGEATAAVSELRKLADEAVTHVVGYTGMTARVDDAPVRVVDRRGWSAVNVLGLKQVVAPLKTPPSFLAGVGGKVAGLQAGMLLAYLSGKVLGQYDVFAADPGQLLLVAPNIVGVERRLRADPRDFRLWVCLHEVTHRTQFTAVPWLRDHFLAEVRAYVEASTPEQGLALGERLRAAGRAAQGHDGASLLDAMQTPAQRAILERLTCILTLLEGHAEMVMDGVGPEVIPSLASIRKSFDRRRESSSPIEQYLRRLFGVDVKLRQYKQGREFVSGVIERVGMERFNQVWTSPETLPLTSELSDPEAWVQRVCG